MPLLIGNMTGPGIDIHIGIDWICMALTCDLYKGDLVPNNCVLRKFITNDESKQCGELSKEVHCPGGSSGLPTSSGRNISPSSLTAFSNATAFDWLLVSM